MSALESGASINVGLSFPSPSTSTPSYLLLHISGFEVTADGRVSAQVYGVLRLVEGYQGNDCLQRAYLVTSLGEVKLYDYQKGVSSSHSSMSVDRIDWFAESFNTI